MQFDRQRFLLWGGRAFGKKESAKKEGENYKKREMSAKKPIADIGAPTPVGNGRHSYIVRGHHFEMESRYEINKCIGSGAYGIVCSAVDRAETDPKKQKVAIKKIVKVFDDVVDGKRILREAMILRFLSHKNVLSVRRLLKPVDARSFEEIYMITDLMDADLATIIKSKQKLLDEHYQYFITQALRGLHYVHSANIIHRDIKPNNLLVNANCDFGNL